jgi:uncharacterized protein YodC (DUF2158 family)
MYACGHSFPMLLAMWWIHSYSDISGSIKNTGPRMTVSGYKSCLSEPGSIMGSTETHLRERAECTLHCNAPSQHKLN